MFVSGNDSAEFTKNGLRIMLTGLELPMETYEKFRHMDVCGEDVARQVRYRVGMDIFIY